jgi:phenylpyruvate tautomerase PptA (4-oxalocrotonate tautomerase family)
MDIRFFEDNDLDKEFTMTAREVAEGIADWSEKKYGSVKPLVVVVLSYVTAQGWATDGKMEDKEIDAILDHLETIEEERS